MLRTIWKGTLYDLSMTPLVQSKMWYKRALWRDKYPCFSSFSPTCFFPSVPIIFTFFELLRTHFVRSNNSQLCCTIRQGFQDQLISNIGFVRSNNNIAGSLTNKIHQTAVREVFFLETGQNRWTVDSSDVISSISLPARLYFRSWLTLQDVSPSCITIVLIPLSFDLQTSRMFFPWCKWSNFIICYSPNVRMRK